VLVSRPDFQEDMIRLRKKWNIPEEGIKTEEHNRSWNKKLRQETDTYYKEEWPKHRQELDQLQEAGKFKEWKARQDELNDAAPQNAFYKDIKAVMTKYLLNPKWREPIRRYILFNDPDNMNLSFGVTIAGHLNDYEPIEYQLCLHIDEDTTLEDIKEIWPDVKEHQKNLIYKKNEKYQPIPNLDRDKRAYELEKEGKSYDEISGIIYEEFNIWLGYNEIGILINRYKKRFNIN
jgi:hypothetical protein